MALPSLRPALRPPLLSLPPRLRTTIYQRSFSSTPRPQLSAFEALIAGPNFLLDTIHGLGIPYYATLPLTAVLVRTSIVYYLSARPKRRNDQIKRNLRPLVTARSEAGMHSIEERRRRLKLQVDSNSIYAIRLSVGIQRIQFAIKAWWRYNRLFGVRIRGYGLLSFGTLITFAEAVRLKCGRSEGLLSILVSPFQSFKSRFAQTPEGDAVSRESVISAAQGGETVDLSSSSPSFPGQTHPEPLFAPNTESPYFDASLQTEGLSWCPDLTLADPTNILPIATGVTMALTSLLRPSSGMGPSPAGPSLNKRRSPLSLAVLKPGKGRTLGLVLGLSFAIFATKMPAGVLVYVLANTVAGWAQNRWLDMMHPLKPPPKACRRRVDDMSPTMD